MSRSLVAEMRFPPRLAAGSERHGARHQAAHGVFGYPEVWPAGPWIVPLFWIAVLLGTLALRLAPA